MTMPTTDTDGSLDESIEPTSDTRRAVSRNDAERMLAGSLGHNDMVRCFSCGVELFDWIPGADPLTQHACASPVCYFMLHSKGQEFINSVQHQELVVGMKQDSQAQDQSGDPDVRESQNTSRNEDVNLVTCQMCLDAPMQVLLRPCNHLCCCALCVSKLDGRCPICRQITTDMEKVYVS
ncbi:E3 ubiquitin-protein ligase XIAP-like [Aplysia californica]|uniref:E3 ubiquitin-protein ligase XIAP-like n=1 Tax=Aplysia californica TaxID=6500 RepID=A0ABM0KB92_APLCA|nr:E3 ubiquitin-protein ligase XIAP-like [Aplysia californica]